MLLEQLGRRRRREVREQALATAMAVNAPKELDKALPPERDRARVVESRDAPAAAYEPGEQESWQQAIRQEWRS